MERLRPLCALALALVCAASSAAEVADPPPACAATIERVLSDFARIAPGVTTRADLRRLLHRDGGIFNARTMRFVHPLCSYCKVQVTFKPQSSLDDGAPLGTDSDPVLEVSKPYLEPMFID